MRIDDPRADTFPASLRGPLLELDADGMPVGFSGPDVENVLIAFHRSHPGYDLTAQVRAWAHDHAGAPPRDPAAALRGWLDAGLREGKLRRSSDRRCVVPRCNEIGRGASGKCVRHITTDDVPGSEAPQVSPEACASLATGQSRIASSSGAPA
jgi:hypothetical protein